jgi:YceI-like domain
MISIPRVSCILALSIAAPLAPHSEALLAADAPSWRVSAGDVRVICPLTVGGSFEARTTALEGGITERSSRPAVLAGALSVDLRSLDTGIGLRNDHLRNVYLEVDKGDGYDKAVLSDIRLGGGEGRGDVDWESFQGKTAFTGTFLLHGTKRTIEGQARIRKEGSTVRVEAGFPLSIAEFGIAKPQYLGIGVKNDVEAKVTLVLSPDPRTGGAR